MPRHTRNNDLEERASAVGRPTIFAGWCSLRPLGAGLRAGRCSFRDKAWKWQQKACAAPTRQAKRPRSLARRPLPNYGTEPVMAFAAT
jgi:hypothetical protein